MTVRTLADPSTRPLSEVARHLVVPEGIVDSVWFDLEERFDEWRVEFDEWQDGVGQLLLSTCDDDMYATTVGGSTISIARQVAKTFIVGRALTGLATLTDDQTMLWTAHRTRTATQTFQKLAAFVQSKRVKPYLHPRNDGIRAANGEQEIRFRNGSAIMFGAREQGFGRGFDEVDVEVFDEAQILSEKALEDMVPAANQSRNPHGALLIFMGTPPRPIDPGEVFKARRRKALALKPADVVKIEAGNALYIECSADPDTGRPGGPALDDPEQIRKANPSYPHRTPQQSIDRMRENLPSDEAWRREALGIWDDDQAGTRAIPESQWSDRRNPESLDGIRCYAVAFSLDGSRSAVGAVSWAGEQYQVALMGVSDDPDAGLGPTAKWLAERWRKAGSFVLAGSAGAGVLRQMMIDEGVPPKRIVVATTPQYLQACEMLRDSLKEGSVSWLDVEGQEALSASVAVCDVDRRGGWVPTVPDGDETPLESVSLALWVSRTFKRKPRGDGERKAVFL